MTMNSSTGAASGRALYPGERRRASILRRSVPRFAVENTTAQEVPWSDAGIAHGREGRHHRVVDLAILLLRFAKVHVLHHIARVRVEADRTARGLHLDLEDGVAQRLLVRHLAA